jgi:hypothetical protein
MANVTVMQQLLLVSLPFVVILKVKTCVAEAPRKAREVEVEEAVLELLWMMTQEAVFV